jgi:predicted component of type VI protein secretion system
VAKGFVLRYTLRDGSASGERQFTGLPIRIGRNPLNDCPIPQQFVSHFHARIEEIDGRICVRDLGSKNGVLMRTGERIPPQTPVDLGPYGLEFLIGPFMHVKLEVVSLPGGPQRVYKTAGTVLGNRSMLEQGLPPGAQPTPAGGAPAVQRSPVPPTAPEQPAHPGALPPLPGPGGMPYGQRAPSNPPGYPPGGTPPPGYAPGATPPPGYPQGVPPGYPAAQRSNPPQPSNVPMQGGYGPRASDVPNPGGWGRPSDPPGGGWGPRGSDAPGGPFGPPGARSPSIPVDKNTQHFGMSSEVLAVLGLRELGGSLVPGVPLETTGDFARLITKLHDTVEVFCRCFVPLREGYAQFVSNMDLQQAASQRALNRSNAYRRVEYAKDPAQVASALLDWRDPTFDAPAAVEGIFADLMLHQVALLDGVMRGVRALLDDLSPDNIERAVSERGGISLSRYKTLWQTYRERFEQMSEESEAFARIFGPEFAAAYREHGRASGDTLRKK